MNPYDLLVGPVLFFGIWGGFRLFKRSKVTENKKPNIPKASDVGVIPKITEKVFPFQNHWTTSCPMCRRNLELISHTFCSCNKNKNGHFHVTCKNREGYGCGFKWMMRTAQ